MSDVLREDGTWASEQVTVDDAKGKLALAPKRRMPRALLPAMLVAMAMPGGGNVGIGGGGRRLTREERDTRRAAGRGGPATQSNSIAKAEAKRKRKAAKRGQRPGKASL